LIYHNVPKYALEVIDNVYQRYPMLEDYLRGIYFVSNFDTAGRYFYSSGKIVIDIDRWNSHPLKREHVLVHEMMHALNWWMEDQGYRIIFDIPEYEIRREVSDYALRSDRELFAEILTFWFTQTQLTPVVCQYGMQIDQMIGVTV
jgi:hypothetical protein